MDAKVRGKTAQDVKREHVNVLVSRQQAETEAHLAYVRLSPEEKLKARAVHVAICPACNWFL